jgi:hypothetical protein
MPCKEQYAAEKARRLETSALAGRRPRHVAERWGDCPTGNSDLSDGVRKRSTKQDAAWERNRTKGPQLRHSKAGQRRRDFALRVADYLPRARGTSLAVARRIIAAGLDPRKEDTAIAKDVERARRDRR